MRSSKNVKDKKEYTIAFFNDFLHGTGSYQRMIWVGVDKAAKNHNLNLICFMGGNIQNPIEQYDYQRNKIYGLIDKNRFDGLVITGSVGNFIKMDKFRSFHKSFMPLPTISIGPILKGITSVIRGWPHILTKTHVKHIFKFVMGVNFCIL